MKWLTNNRGDVDCFACAWLVTRFIDPSAKFLFVAPGRALAVARAEGATPYNIPGVELTDHDEQCSFDAFLTKFGLKKPALRRLALIVRSADHNRIDLSPQAGGLLAITVGLSRMYREDYDERLEYALFVYDALYAWCGGRTSAASQPAVAYGSSRGKQSGRRSKLKRNLGLSKGKR